MDPEIPAHGLGRCTDNTNNPSEPPQEEESASNTRPEALQKRSRARSYTWSGCPAPASTSPATQQQRCQSDQRHKAWQHMVEEMAAERGGPDHGVGGRSAEVEGRESRSSEDGDGDEARGMLS